MKGRRALAKILPCIPKPQNLRISAGDHEDADENRALNNRAGYGAEGIPGLGSERGCALKSDKAEQGKNHTEAHARRLHALEAHLVQVQMQAVSPQKQSRDSDDKGDRDDLDPEHETGGNLDVAIGNQSRDTNRNCDRDWRRKLPPRDCLGQDICVVNESADHRCSSGDISQQKGPRRYRPQCRP